MNVLAYICKHTLLLKITADELRNFFSQHGSVTDLQLKYKSNGAFRHFAFVGFKTGEEAKGALEATNNTYFKHSKILVEYCQGVCHEIDNKEIKNQKSKGKSKFDDKNQAKKEKKVAAEKKNGNKSGDRESDIQNDPKFIEFANTQRNMKSNRTWANEGIELSASKEVEFSDDEKGKKQKPVKKNAESIKGTYKNTIKLKGIPQEKCTKKCVKEFLHPLKPISLRIPRKIKSIAYAAFRTVEEVEQAVLKHRNLMWGSLITVLRYAQPDCQSSVNEKYANQQKLSQEDTEAVIADTGRLFIRNLSYSCTEQDIQDLFASYGPVAEIHLPIDKESKKITGIGFVTFMFPEHALKAFADLDGSIFQGRMLHLIPGQSKPEIRESIDAKSSFKKKRQSDALKTASSSHNWNALFVNMNAISDVISEKYDIKKSKLLMDNNSSESAAVRMALAETQIVNEIKDFLVGQGVKISAFDDEESVRSKTVIVVKNLPAKTTVDELQELFSRYAKVSRIILPTMAVTAIVELDNSPEAKRAFKKLAYLNFKGNPIYLEWAPVDIFSGNENEPDLTANSSEQNVNKSVIPGANGGDKTILVKNLDPNTCEEKLGKHFAGCGTILKTYIVQRKSTQGESKSLGYGFVEFKNRKSADKALKTLQNSILDNSSLSLKLSNKAQTVTGDIKSSSKSHTSAQRNIQLGSKILVRNIAFEAVESDIRQLFTVYGQLKSIRLPKKVTGNHRGFGFVDFVSEKDAKKAFDSLSLSTHLYGRRLVLEWSKEEDDEDELSAQKRQILGDSNKSKKRLKKSTLLEELNDTKPLDDDE